MEESRMSQLESLVASLTEQLTNLKNHESRSLTTSNLDGVAVFNSGDTAWMLASSALVLMMTMPGLAIYYAGMVRTKNVLAVIMQSFTITCLITVSWLAYGYSLSFGPAETVDTKFRYPVFGSADRTWLFGMNMIFGASGTYTSDFGSYHYLAPTIPEPVYVVFQLTFAIITAALITGSFADRMKYGPMIVFILAWHAAVYCPVAHSNWHQDGFLHKRGVLDYAGGNVVHINSGVSGLVAAIILGHRKGYGKERFDPHNIVLTFIGMSLLWVGWYGFNAGSATTASFNAGYAMLATQIATAVASLSWMGTEWIIRGTPSVLGMISGAVAGLVAITPACGYVDQTGAFVTGLVAGPLCYFGAQVKHYLGYDDALDAFGVHAIGGIVGGICTGFFANPDICGAYGVYYGSTFTGGRQLATQLYAMSVIIGWSGFATFCILQVIQFTIGLRVSEAEEDAGLDASLHGESLEHKEYDVVKPPVEAKEGEVTA